MKLVNTYLNHVCYIVNYSGKMSCLYSNNCHTEIYSYLKSQIVFNHKPLKTKNGHYKKIKMFPLTTLSYCR